MKVFAAIAAAGLLVAGPALAEDAALGPIAPTPAALEHARHLLEAMHMDEMMDQLGAQMMRPMLDAMLKNTPPEKREAVEAMQASILEDTKAMIPRHKEAMVQIYARNLTETELKDIDAFYSSPSGRAVLTKVPALTGKLVPVMLADMPAMMNRAFDRYCSKTTCTPEERESMRKAAQSFGRTPNAS